MNSSPSRLWIVALGLLVVSCDQAMTEQPKRKPLQGSTFFADGRSSRSPVEGTVARGQLRIDEHLYRGTAAGAFATEFPFPVTAGILERGRDRYNIFCSPCHDRTGSGQGIIVQRGYRMPPSFHHDRLRLLPPGQLFDTVSRGLNAMPAYADQIPVRDRWSIVAYLRALQLSRDVPKEKIPDLERLRLEAEPP